jgi:regulatory protein
VARERSDRNRPPLDAAAVERLAIDYVARYATSRAKVRAYLQRKLTERGWAGDGAPPLDALIAKLAESGFVDDRAFAEARTASLGRRGYGAQRVGMALRAAGIDPEDSEAALDGAAESAWAAAEIFARRRRIGPFASVPGDRDQRQKALAAMLRAGHPNHVARAFAYADPGISPVPEEEGYERRG